MPPDVQVPAMSKSSLLRRILPPLAGVVCAITLIIVALGIGSMRRAVLDRARLRAVQLASSERDSLERFMRDSEHHHLQRLIEQLGHHPDVAAVRVLGPDKVVHSSSLATEIGHPAGPHGDQVNARGDVMAASLLQPSSEGQLAVHMVQPFTNRGDCQHCHPADQQVLGMLDLDVSVNPHMTGMLAFSMLSGLFGLLYVGAVVGVVGPLIALVVGRPMRRLITAMQQVQAGDLNVQVPPSGTTEMDAVTDGFNHMVTQLRQGRAAEEEARRLHLERVEQLAVVGELAAGLAHEIRNPLSGVKAVVEVLAEDAHYDESRRAVLHDAASELSRMDQIVRDLLQYARPRVPSCAPFDLNHLVRDAATLTLAPALAKGATLTLALAEDLPRSNGDADLVRQVLVNLLLNSQQAARAPDLLHVVVSTGTRNGDAWCRVQDNGTGVPAGRADAIFRPFVTTKKRGTGLGLSISRRVIELQGGRLALDNPGESGASFTFTLPMAPVTASA